MTEEDRRTGPRGGREKTPRERKPPRAVTEGYLERAALAYLERYASSSANLRRVLTRKVQTRCRLRSEDPEAFLPLVEEVVAKTLRTGLIDDRTYAEARVATLRRRGGSARAIRAKLAAKGVGRELAAEVVDPSPEEEQVAAEAFARRRKLGPFRPGERAVYRDKDLAALARAGFSFDVARRVLDGEE